MFVGFDAFGTHQNRLGLLTNLNLNLLQIRFPGAQRTFVRVADRHANYLFLTAIKTSLHDNLQAYPFGSLQKRRPMAAREALW